VSYPPRIKLSVVVPCFNEERTLQTCVERVLGLCADDLELEVVIVDDCSRDRSLAIAHELASKYPEIRVLHHERNQGKGAALRTGFRMATGDFVAVQDADLEYNPLELRGLLEPLRDGRADVVMGSRFKGQGPHRVLYFWHYVGNRVLTLLSNMFTDLNLSDMETCYKVFRREVIQDIQIQENRFGFEPEIVAKIAHRHLQIYEMAVSYSGRTYAEGKKINWKDGVRALYCIFRYNSDYLPLPMHFLMYLLIGAAAAVINLGAFLALARVGVALPVAIVMAFVLAAIANYFLCIVLIFRHRARWNSVTEVAMYAAVVVAAGALDLGLTTGLLGAGAVPWLAKSSASAIGLVFNFLGRRFVVF
jgi:glycosyltransferase involved in cell wall biosynthesis